jgi:prolyl-tRNA synthetase
MKGIPLRIEIGRNEVKDNKYKIVRRDIVGDNGIVFAAVENIVDVINETLKAFGDALYKNADENLKRRTNVCNNMDEVQNFEGLAKIMWCGSKECENSIKEATTKYHIDSLTGEPQLDELGKRKVKEKGMTIRCIPNEQENIYDTCVYCGGKAEHMVLVGKSY